MSKWNKPQGVVVPLESLLKERRKENCPAPRRSAGLVGRWGITSFTSIRSRSYVAEYNNVDLKDATGLDLGTGESPDSVVNNLLGSNNSEPARPRKFFKSRNTIPPPPPPPPTDHLGHHSPYGANAAGGGYGAAGPSDLWGNRANVTTTSPQQQQFYQPLPAAAATPQFSPTGPQSANVGQHTADAGLGYAMQQQQQQLLHTLPVTKEKKPGRKKKSLEPADGGGAVGRSKPAASAKPPKKEKEKKEKRPKKAKKEPAAPGAGDQEQKQQQQQQEQPKRNSSRIRNRVVNYNEDEDSNDYGRTVAGRSTGNHQPTLGTPEYGSLGPPATDPSFAGVLEQQQLHQDAHVTTATYQPMAQRPVSSSSSPAGGYHSGGEGRYGVKPSTTTVTTPLPSPGEHRPILLRISKGTSMLISTDSEEVSTNNSTPPTPAPQHHYGHHHHHQPLEAQQQQEQQPEEEDEEEEEEDFDGDLPPRTLLAEATGPTTTTTTVHDSSVDYFKQQQQQPFYNQPIEPFPHNTATPPAPCGELGAAGGAAGGSGEAAVVAPAPAKSELKIKISLGGKPLISSTTSGAGGTAAPGSTTPGSGSGAAGPTTTGKGSKSSSSKYNFKKRAIEREKARVSSKRSKVELSDGEQQQQQQQQQQHPLSVSSSTAAKPAAAVLPRPSFPLPGTDTYEVFRTLSSLSGGDDFDSQSSILGSASSDNNTPKHTLAPGEDCQIIHSRGSSDCGSDLELSQNSSTAAAPPSDVYSESENTQDNNSHPQPGGLLRGGTVALAAACTTTTSVAACSSETVPPSSVELLPAAAAAAPERVEVLKLNLKNVVPAGARVTRNKMKHSNPADEQQGAEGAEGTGAKQPLLLRVGGRSGRTNRAAASNNNNNNNVVVRGTSTVSEKRTRKQTDTMQAEQPRDEAAVGEPMPPHRSPSAVGTGGEAAVAPEAPAVAPKPSVTRQYSRRKKNVVPPDYLGEPSAPAGPESTSGGGGGEQRHNGDALGTEQQQQSTSSSAATPTSTVAPSAAAAPAQEPTVPPAPMRLVLQKKGTIFKSRPLVGSSDGATDTKKRHVYKHKWDHGNGLLDQDGKAGGDAPGGGGSAGASGGVGGGAAGVGVSDGGLLANHHHAYATDGAFDDDVDGDGHEAAGGLVGAGAGGGGGGGGGGSGGGGGGSSGPSQLDFDGAFFDGDAPPSAMPSRSKRMKTFGAGGSAGGVQSGGLQGTGGGAEARGAGSMPSYYQYGRAQHAAGDAYDGAAGAFDDDETDGGDDEYGGGGGGAKMRCDRQTKPFYTIVRNVKNSHQMQEIGEFQEMDDDVDYILSALHPDNPISTRCLSALQLATKCMKPAFKMHVRAHGVVTRFFRALSDAHQDPSLGLCTAAIMYVFSQDKLNMDLDRDSLALMLNLLDTDHRLSEGGTAAQQQLQKNRQRVKELCEEIKGAGKGGGGGKHIDTDRVTAGSLAMESLLSLTSQRAGEWFKDELRNLGGIEHLIKTVAECYEQVPDRAADWHEPDVAKLRKIERCLRVLNNVSLFNCANQTFLLEHRAGLLVQILVRLYRQVDRDLPHYPTDDATPKESIGVLLRDLLQPMLHMLITLTHSFDDQARGAHLVGKQPDVINNTMNLLLRIANYVPQRCVFDLHLLALTLLLHLARPSQHNRQQVLRYVDKETNRDGFKALVAYFDQQEEKASHAEEKTNAILDTPSEAAGVEDAETKLIQKAEHHMEHTYMGSHVCMLICQLVMDEPGLEQIARAYLKNGNFKRMVAALSRYYEFLNLTTNADAESTAHKRQTKEAIDYLGQLDGCESAGAARASSGPGGSSSGSGNSDPKAAAFCQ